MKNDFNEKVKVIKAAIELEVASEDLEGLQGKLLRCINLFALSSEMCARATVDLRNAELKVLQEHGTGTGASMRLKAMTGEEQGKMELADRLNAGLTHCVDGLRSMISLKKIEFDKTYQQ